jgi:hypothetical protein
MARQTYTKEQRERKNEQCKSYYHKQRTPEEEEKIKEKRRKYQADFRARLKLKFQEDPEYEKQYLENARQRAIKSYLRKKVMLDKMGLTVYGYYHQDDPNYKSKKQRRKEYEEKQKLKKTKKIGPCERLTINKGKFVVTMD